MTRIKGITLLIIFFGLGGLQGCSFLPFKDCNLLDLSHCYFEKDQQIIDTGRFNYHYKEPARKPLTTARVKSLKLPLPASSVAKNNSRAPNQYYSANGNVCRTIDRNGSEVVCAVSGRWQASPSVFLNSPLQ
ncbi:MAG: hypothetical protein KAH03_07150 [Cocleimonas sp.]|nr:hypothetical protein [Cocleimonas sp.]